MPSASKQKRLAEKAAKAASGGALTPTTKSAGTSTNGNSTPMTSLSANASEEALADAQAEMKKLNLATDRSAVSWAPNSLFASRAQCSCSKRGGKC